MQLNLCSIFGLQFTFSPVSRQKLARGSTSEVEDFEVSLEGVSVLELAVKPDLTRGEAPATLAKWRLA